MPTDTAGQPRLPQLLRVVFRRGEPQRILHLTWFAFFLAFMVWFNFAPFAGTIQRQFGLTKAQIVTLGLCNLALTVPARLIVGGLLDRFGPRRTFSAILIYAAIPCMLFATAHSFTMLIVSRLLIGIVGAGFVVGIRMVSEWFPPAELGTAEGFYGGWGNFGAAAATLGLPIIASIAGGSDGWRWAAAVSGIITALYGVAYLRLVTDTPGGQRYERARRASALEVTSPGAVVGLIALSIPLAASLAVISWRVWRVGVISAVGMGLGFAFAAALFAVQTMAVWKVNATARHDAHPAEEKYPFRSVVVLSFAYFCTFGTELAMVSYLPQFFESTWKLSTAVAGAAASTFAFMNLVSRPGGGLLSDLLGNRRRWLAILLGGLAVSYLAMSTLSSRWPVVLAIGLVLVAAVFAQAGNGAVFAIVPLVKKRVSGQISGMAGAYGNCGGIAFLATLLFLSPQQFFLVMAAISALATVACRWLVEPAGSRVHRPGPIAATASEPVLVSSPASIGV
jgi:NNP family nitrate/nitrite transporter-like MFS transporter